MSQEVLLGSMATAEKLFRVPVIIKPDEAEKKRHGLNRYISGDGKLLLPYSVTATDGRRWADDGDVPYLGFVTADKYTFNIEHIAGTSTIWSVINAAKAVIDPQVAEYEWIMSLVRTDDRDYFQFKIINTDQSPNAPDIVFGDSMYWNWSYLFAPQSPEYIALLKARTRD